MEQKTHIFIRTLAVIGFIALLMIGLWGTVQVVRFLPNVFSALAAVNITSIFKPAERLVISAPLSVNSGEVFEVSWEHESRNDAGVYTLTYACREGVSFETPTGTGAYAEVFCNTPFNLTNETDSIKIIAISQSRRFMDVPLSLTYNKTDGSGEAVSDDFLLTVVNSQITDGVNGGNSNTGNTGSNSGSGTGTQNPGNRSTNTRIISGGTASNPNGVVDLTARVLAVGYVDQNANFVASSTPNINRLVAVKFEVENVGTKTSPQWSFNVVIPTFPAHIYHANTQQELHPGDRIEYTIWWDKTKIDSNAQITINVDPTGFVKESNETNNIIKHNFTVGI